MGVFSEELSAFRVLLDGLGVELGCELEVVVDVGFLRFNFQIGGHGWLAHTHTERARERKIYREERKSLEKEESKGEAL